MSKKDQKQEFTQKLGMEFNEAGELFSEETLNSMQMNNLIGGDGRHSINWECFNGGDCRYSTNNICSNYGPACSSSTNFTCIATTTATPIDPTTTPPPPVE